MTPYDHIIAAVAAVYGVSIDDILGSSRLKVVSEARQMAMYLYVERTRLNLCEIARVFGRHHATVIYAIQKMRFLVGNDKSVARRYDKIKLRLDAK